MASYEQLEQVYAAIGKGITSWFNLETQLVMLFAQLVGLPKSGNDSFLHFRLFYASTNFRAQLGMIDIAIQNATQDEALLAEWTSIKNKLLRIKKRRDAMAHCTLATDNTTKECVAVVSHFTEKRKKPEGKMSIADLQRATNSFIETQVRVIAFQGQFSPRRKQHTKSV